MQRLRRTLEHVSAKWGDQCTILIEQDRYLRVLFRDGTSSEQSIGEFYFTPNDTTVQFRIGSLPSTTNNRASLFRRGASLRNLERSELLRNDLRYLKLTVLRNRKRFFFFGESDLLDTFGPGTCRRRMSLSFFLFGWLRRLDLNHPFLWRFSFSSFKGPQIWVHPPKWNQTRSRVVVVVVDASVIRSIHG